MAKRGPKTSRKGKEIRLDPATSLDPPSILNPEALCFWKEIAPTLIPLGLLIETDVLVLALLCNEITAYQEAQAQLKEGSWLEDGYNNNPIKSPWVLIRQDSVKNILSMIKTLGMTPQSRKELGALIAAHVGQGPKENEKSGKVPLSLAKT